MDAYVTMFRALSDPIRLRTAALLRQAGQELCVCEITDALEEPQYKISRALKELQKASLVTERREGKWVYYRLPRKNSTFQDRLLALIDSIPRSVLRKDLRELKQGLKLREGGKCLRGVQKTHLLSRR